MLRYIASISFLLIILFSCKKTENDPTELKKAVLEAYIFAGEPVENIHLTELIPFGGEDTSAQAISDAVINIIWKGKYYTLEPTPDKEGYYHYPGSDLEILVGQTYQIEFVYFNRTTRGQTTIPPAPQAVVLSNDSMSVESFNFSWLDSLLGDTTLDSNLIDTSVLYGDHPDTVQVSWDNAGQDYFYIVAENVEPVDTREEIFPGLDFLDFFVFTRPTVENKYTISIAEVAHYGKHKIKVYRVNQDYVDLFSNLDQDSRTLNEPPSNLDNGLGIFTGFNSTDMDFYVSKK